MRPPALMRGPRTKPRCHASGGSPSEAASSRAGEAGTATMAHYRQPLGHEGAVEAGERHDVGDGGEGNEIEGVRQGRFGPLRAEVALQAQGAVQRHKRQEHHAGRAEMAEPRQVVEAVRIDHGPRRGQDLGGRMMIENDHVEPGFGRLLPEGRGRSCRNRRRPAGSHPPPPGR